MRRSTLFAALAGLLMSGSAQAYEYTLQFTPNPGGRGLTVAGYGFSGNTVVGNCSYYISTSGSGRGGHGSTTYYYNTCSWDLYGNLLSITPGTAPTAPTPVSSVNGLTIYAQNPQGDTTGIDAAHGNIGFVNTPSAQYEWVTQPGVQFLPNQQPVVLRLKLTNAGDLPLIVTAIDATPQLARAWVKWTTCKTAPVPAGASCQIAVEYDPRKLPPGDDPYTAYDRLRVGIVSNSGQATDFVETYEVPVAPGG
jgi:hypothetical protein